MVPTRTRWSSKPRSWMPAKVSAATHISLSVYITTISVKKMTNNKDHPSNNYYTLTLTFKLHNIILDSFWPGITTITNTFHFYTTSSSNKLYLEIKKNNSRIIVVDCLNANELGISWLLLDCKSKSNCWWRRTTQGWLKYPYTELLWHFSTNSGTFFRHNSGTPDYYPAWKR